MNKKYIKTFAAALLFTLAATSCVDEKEYEPKLPQDPSITEKVDYALPIDEHKTFVHPGCMVSQEDFDRAKRHIQAGDEPWNSAFENLKQGRFFNQNFLRISLYKGYQIRSSSDKSQYIEDLDEYIKWAGNYDQEAQDGSSAYSKAVYWKLTGDTQAADFAVNMLNTWAKECKGITGDPNKTLAFNATGYDFASIAELLRDYEGWKKEDQAAFKKWLVDVVASYNVKFLKNHANWPDGSTHYWSNWDLGCMLSLMAIGVYLDEPQYYNMAINYITYGSGNGNWRRYINYIHPKIEGEDDIDLGQTQESGRDQGHDLLSIRLGAAICRIAWNQGDDLYGYDDNRFLKGAEFVAKYNYGPMIEQQNHTTLTYPFKGLIVGPGTYHDKYSDQDRGQYCSGFVSIYEHYKKYKHLSTRYVRWAAKTPGQSDLTADTTKVVNIEPETYDHNQGAGSSFGTLLFTEDESALRK